MSTAPAVEAHGFGWRHPRRRAWALSELDLVIRTGERVLVLGASGSGKSTLLLALAGLLDDESGGEMTGTLAGPGRATPPIAR